MAKYASGKFAKAISDRSGFEFPYREMVKEWNGSIVHRSEFEPKQPQLNPPYVTGDAIALKNPRPMHKSGIIVSLKAKDWPGQFTVVQYPVTVDGVTTFVPSQQPSISPTDMNNTRQLEMKAGNLTVSIT